MNPVFDELCLSVSAPTSPIQLASYFAGLTASLSGLTLGALAFILGKKESAPPPTIALFTFSLLVLGLDALMFAFISARQPSTGGTKPGEEYLCYLAGARLLPAIGLLIVGSMGLFAGIGWMVVQYAKQNEIEDVSFGSLCGILIVIIGITTGFYLIHGSLEYLSFVNFPAAPSDFATVSIVVFGATMTFIGCSIVLMRTVGLCRYLKYNRNWGELTTPRFRAMAIAAISTGCYGLLCVLYIGGITFADSTESLRSPGVVWFTIGLCLVPPLVIFIVIGYAVPGTKLHHAWKRYRQPSPSLEKSVGL